MHEEEQAPPPQEAAPASIGPEGAAAPEISRRVGSILDAVEHGLGLVPDALALSRGVLRDFGNMSSATLMFVLEAMLRQDDTTPGVAIAFGPGVAAEGFRFAKAP